MGLFKFINRQIHSTPRSVSIGDTNSVRYNKALKHFREIALQTFTNDELAQMTHDYAQELQNGLQKKPSSLKMIPTFIKPVDIARLNERQSAFVIEIGGSKLRGAFVSKKDDSSVIERDHYEIDIKSTTSDNPRVFQNADDFYSTIIQNLGHLLDKPFQALGIIYTFPGDGLKTTYGVDVHSQETLTKEFVIPGIGKELVGKTFLDLLRNTHQVPDMPTVVLNDTPAVALSKGAKIGGVVGTGFNLAVTANEELYNTESGGFNRVPQNDLTTRVDQESSNKGHQFAEKQISGMYLGALLHLAVTELIKRGLLSVTPTKTKLTAELMSALLAPSVDLKTLEAYFERQVDEQSLRILQALADILRTRSAQLVGMMIGTTISTFAEEFSSNVTVPIEGSVFERVPEYKSIVEETAKQVALNHTIQAISVVHAGILGAGAAALSWL